MNREQAEKLLAALIFDDLDEPSKAELQAYLQTDDELRERLTDMRMAAKLANDAVNEGPAPVLSDERLENLRRLAGLKVVKRALYIRFSVAAAAVLVFGCVLTALLLPSLNQVKRYNGTTFAPLATREFSWSSESVRSAGEPTPSVRSGPAEGYASDPALNHNMPAGMGDMGGYGMGGGFGPGGGNAASSGVEGTGSMGGFAGGQNGSAISWSNSVSTKGTVSDSLVNESRDQATILDTAKTPSQSPPLSASTTDNWKGDTSRTSTAQPVVPSGPQVVASPPSPAKPVDGVSKTEATKTNNGLPSEAAQPPSDRAAGRLNFATTAEAERTQPERRKSEDTNRGERIKQYLTRADEYMKQQKYDAAMGQAEAVLAADPLNNEALILRQTLNDTLYQRKEVALDAQSNRERAKTLQDAKEAMVPYSGEMTYPKNWRELASGETKKTEEVTKSAEPANGVARRGVDDDVSVVGRVPGSGDAPLVGGLFREGGKDSGEKSNISDTKVSMDFQDASLDTVLKYLSKEAGLTILASGVPLDSRVTVNTHQPISVDSAVSLINSALLDKDLAATRTGKTLNISSVANAKKKTLQVVHVTKDSDVPLDSDEIMTFVMPVRYVDAMAMANVLMPMLPEYATLEANRDGNALIITDSASNVRRMMKIVQSLDQHLPTVSEIKVWRLTNAQASGTSQLIDSIFQQEAQAARGGGAASGIMNMMFGGRGGGGGGTSSAATRGNQAVVAAADDRTNSVVVRGSTEALNIIDGMIGELDKRTTEIADVKTKQLQYADASNVAEVVNKMFEQTTLAGGRGGIGGMTGTRGGQGGSSNSSLSVTAAADSRTNTVVITGPQAVLDVVDNVVKGLDQQTPNVTDVKTFHLQYADATNTATLMNEVFGTSRTTSRSASRSGTTNQPVQFGGRGGDQTSATGSSSDGAIVAAADPRTNSVVISGAPEKLDVVKSLMAELDQNPEQERRIFVYPLKNGTASNLVTTLNNLFTQLRSFNNGGSTRTSTTPGAGGRGGAAGGGSTSASESNGANDLSDQTYFQADTATNSLLVLTSMKNYQLVKPVIDDLDKSGGKLPDKNPTEVNQSASSNVQPIKQNNQTADEDADVLPAESRFKVVPVNPWVMTERDALSTFALNVDTASYALCRRYIRKGYLPPIGAVRMEEFINAFDYAYPQRSDATFSVYADGAPSPFAQAGQDVTLLKIAVKARTVGRDQRKPAHLVLVVDTSASMGQSDRLPLVQSALNLLIDKLSDGDRVSLITCAKDASLHLEAVSAKQKDAIREKIGAIQPAGPTNLLAGLRLGYATARKAFAAGQINQVVLCSDGVANVGQTDANDVLREVAADRKQGITLTCVGVGYGAYNDAFLEGLADHGDGRYVFLDPSPEAQADLVGQLASTLQTVAKDARIQVQFDPSRVRRYRLIGYENRDIEDKRFRDDTVEAGAVGSGQCSTALYEVELAEPSNSDAGAEIGTVFVRYRNAETNQMEEFSKPLSRSIVHSRSIQEDPRFFLAAGAARFAEWLRQSEHVRNTSLADIQRVLDQVGAALPLDRDIRDLAALAHQAENLPRAP